MLLEHETLKLKQLEEQHTTDQQEWKTSLKPRKQVRNIPINYIVFQN